MKSQKKHLQSVDISGNKRSKSCHQGGLSYETTILKFLTSQKLLEIFGQSAQALLSTHELTFCQGNDESSQILFDDCN